MRCGKGHKQPRTPRRAAQFWAPLNNWWRGYLADNERRPVTSELQDWYNANADTAWPTCKPSWKEARIHAKCLRSTEQVKNYFREYRARSKAGDTKQEPGEDSGSFEGGGSLPMHEHGIMLSGPSQGAPDTLDLLVSSHNARIAQMNIGNTFGSPFAAKSQSPGLNAPRTSAPPPMWQMYGKAVSERLTGRKSMPDMLDAGGGFGGDRSLSFGAGPCGGGPCISFQTNKADKSVSPFSLVTDRSSCPTSLCAGEVLTAANPWADIAPHESSSPQDSGGYPAGARQRRSTAEHPNLHHSTMAAAPQSPAPASIRFTRSFTPQTTGIPGAAAFASDALLEATLTDPSGPGEQSWSRSRSQIHLHRTCIDGLAAGLPDDVARRQLLQMTAQDALGSEIHGSQHGHAAGAVTMVAAAAATHPPSRQETSNQEPPNSEAELSELWALAEDEPVTHAPERSSAHLPLNQASFLQETAAQLMSLQPQDRVSASSDPGPLLPPPYPRSGSFPMASIRTSCLSADGMAPHGLPRASMALLAAHYPGLAPSSDAAGTALGAAAHRRSSDLAAAELTATDAHRSFLAGAATLAQDVDTEPRSTWPHQQDFSRQQQQLQLLQWQQQQQQQQLPPLHSLRVNSSRVPMTRREKEELEQQMLVESHNQLLWPRQERTSGAGHQESAGILAAEAPRPAPWADMEWDKPPML